MVVAVAVYLILCEEKKEMKRSRKFSNLFSPKVTSMENDIDYISEGPGAGGSPQREEGSNERGAAARPRIPGFFAHDFPFYHNHNPNVGEQSGAGLAITEDF